MHNLIGTKSMQNKAAVFIGFTYEFDDHGYRDASSMNWYIMEEQQLLQLELPRHLQFRNK